MKIKKYIQIEEEVLVRLVEGKYVEGSLHRDKWTGMITFNAYNRLPRKRQKDELLKKTPWGWLKASIERVKRYSSVPKDLSLEEKMACGIGACLGCIVKTKDRDHHTNVHNRRICKDGPVFDAREVNFS